MAEKHIARKRFGQNFLHDADIIRHIVASIAPKADAMMVELGPGQGAISAPLLERLDSLHAIELDRDLIPILERKLGDKGLVIHPADALRFDFSQLMQDDKPLRVVGTLPYNISPPLLFHLLSYQERIDDMHFMLQLEVVDRLSAEPNSKAYGRLSVICQYHCQVDKLFNVPPGAFNPAPKVMSAIVRLKPRPFAVKANNVVLLELLLRHSFSMRRKTLRNNLKNWLTSEQLDVLDIDLGRRPEQLSVAEFVQLSNQINLDE